MTVMNTVTNKANREGGDSFHPTACNMPSNQGNQGKTQGRNLDRNRATVDAMEVCFD